MWYQVEPSSQYTFADGPTPASAERPDQPVDALTVLAEGALGDVGLEPRVVHDERHLGERRGGRADVGGIRPETLVDGDDRRAGALGGQVGDVGEERLAHRTLERVAAADVGVGLPRHDVVLARQGRHALEGGVEVTDLGEGLALEQHPVVATERLGEAAGDLHLLDRHRVVVVDDGQGREHGHRRVRRPQDEVGPPVDGEAQLGAGTALCLREACSEPVGLRVEEVRLDVDDDLAVDGPERGLRGRAVGRRLGRHGERAPGRPAAACFVVAAGGEGEQRRGRAHGGPQERPPVDAEGTGVGVGVGQRPPHRFGGHRRGWNRCVLPVRPGPQQHTSQVHHPGSLPRF